MEELYPGRAKNGGGFTVTGFAKTDQTSHSTLPPETTGEVNVGFLSFGPGGLFVRQVNKPEVPSFHFRPLTTKYLANAIWNDQVFKFSLVQERIGDVKYVSGAAARDYGWEVSQGIVSLYADGSWSKSGLKLAIHGELGERSALLDKTTPIEFKQAFYGLEVDIPWSNLRFLFYDEINFLLWNYDTYGPS